MLSFKNDYSEGCAKEVLDALVKTNMEKTIGYGEDEYTLEAKKIIQNLVADSNAYIEFLVGGTQTNLTVISSLNPYEAVISADSGHINVHETGAIEATGHKVISVPNVNGKLVPEAIKKVILEHNGYHMVIPKMVYISNTTEYGTIYTKSELEALRKICDEYNLLLFLDGARLGSALASKENDLSFKDIYKLCDIFYIGGTKNGALFGEALVIRNIEHKEFFKYRIKQRGALLAKGRLLGLQFKVLLEDNLFIRLAKQANLCADSIRKKLAELKIKQFMPNTSNQIFIEISKEKADLLHQEFLFEDFIELKDKVICRLVTSFSTTEEDVEELGLILEKYF